MIKQLKKFKPFQFLYYGLGKRKTSIAKVFLTLGQGKILINNQDIDSYFKSLGDEKNRLKEPLYIFNIEYNIDLVIYVKGGGIYSQLNAIILGISRALLNYKEAYKEKLKKIFFLNRDSRIKERRKYGLKKARKAAQYTKR